MNYNQQLSDLYRQHWSSLIWKAELLSRENKPANPLLLKIPDEKAYQDANIKVMFVGKETRGWEGELGSSSISTLQKSYCAFLTGHNKHKSSLFWQFIKLWTNRLEENYPNASISLMWNNIFKIGRISEKREPSTNTQNLNTHYFNVFKKELHILQPDIVIFLTGPQYDKALQTYLPGLILSPVQIANKKQLAHCIHPLLPTTSFRTYHPQYLNTLKPKKNTFHRDIPIDIILKTWSKKHN